MKSTLSLGLYHHSSSRRPNNQTMVPRPGRLLRRWGVSKGRSSYHPVSPALDDLRCATARRYSTQCRTEASRCAFFSPMRLDRLTMLAAWGRARTPRRGPARGRRPAPHRARPADRGSSARRLSSRRWGSWSTRRGSRERAPRVGPPPGAVRRYRLSGVAIPWRADHLQHGLHRLQRRGVRVPQVPFP